MTPFEYALGLISILMSLALADVVMCVHRLMRHARTVRWDARPLIATVLIVVEIIRIWFAQWTLRDLDTALAFPVYVALFGHILLLVMTAVAALPDEVSDGCDLGEFYARNRTYFWGAFAANQAAYFALWLVFGGDQANVGGAVGAMDWFRILGPFVIYLSLALVRWKWLHYVAPSLVLAFYVWLYWGQTIAA